MPLEDLSSKVRTSPKIPLAKKLLWGAGGAADNILYNGIATLVLPIFNVGLGVDAVKIGIAMGIPRLLDALTDPLIGNLSDNTRSRWGRRRPYIFFGAVVAGTLLAVLFNPLKGLSQEGLFWWLLIVASLFYVAYAVFVIPYSAMGLEITSDYNERTRVLAWRPYMGLLVGLGVPWLYKLCFILGNTEAEGARTVAVIMGVLAIGLGILPALFIAEHVPQKTSSHMPLLHALKVTFSNSSFLLLSASTLCILLGIFLASPLGLYVSIYHVFGGKKELASMLGGWSGTASMAAGLAGLPLATWLAKRLGKRHATLALLLLGLLSVPLVWWMYTPENPWLQIVPGFIFGLAINGSFLIGVSMLGDVCDDDELKTGHRREGLYSASLEFGKKCAIALSTILVGYLLLAVGFDEKAAMQSDQTTTSLRIGYMIVLGVPMILASVFIYFFPITHQRAIENRRLLDERIAASVSNA
jgi:GPH family glycoside/pentoside/hexuronide:cation symporter